MIDLPVYGFPDAAAEFDRRHPEWRNVMPRLARTVDLAFTRIQVMDKPIDKFAYFYGTLIAEDFMEIFLMAANGYGFGAMKLLRSMYEHTVTLRYLHDHPDEFQRFFDFDRVQQYKLMRPILETFGENALPPDTVTDAERRYEEVKEQYRVKKCNSKTCIETQVNHTWSKLHFAAMAKKAGAIGTLIVPGYFIPLRHAHSTYRAMTERLEKGDEHLGFKRESQPEEADQALMTAHNCLLVALEVQEERFKAEGLQDGIQKAMRDWALIWSPEALPRMEAGNTLRA
jgi:hypothetical protein